MKTITTLFLVLIFSGMTWAQVAPDKYQVRFTDRDNSPYSIQNPEQFLTQKAIDRRTAHGIAIEENDLPVNPSYIQAVANTGAVILTVSKWMNSVTVQTSDPSVVTVINQLPFVLSISKGNLNPLPPGKESIKPFFDNETYGELLKDSNGDGIKSGLTYNYGNAFNQISMLNGIALHDSGYDGAGMSIAVLDAGFLNTNTLSAFTYLWSNNKILGYKDFVNPQNPNIFGSHSHGTSVLSTMGANLPGQMVGTAPQADYWLLRSEDAPTEYLIEELNWVSAAEFADSVGADIINSSLGYTTFDDPSQDHTYQDMDGNTTPITIAADMAVSKGMIVVNSAGNSGNSSWYYIGAPADGDSVFSIGAVNASGNYVSFSSKGPTYDGRTKPDVVAQGSGTTVINAFTGNVSTGSGTSFSSPITAGMVACLWQAHPNRRNTEVVEAIRQSGSQAASPDQFMGFGIPDYLAAHNHLSLPISHNFSLQIKVFLEGPFNGTSMNTDLNPFLPLSHPYGDPPFNHTGLESVPFIPGNDVVDWVLIELRDAPVADLASEETILARRAAFLLSDGRVVDLDGTSSLQFSVSVVKKMYVVVRHRNHLDILSYYPLIVQNDSSTYDFSTGSVKTFGNIAGSKEITSGNWGMIAGDGNADGIVDVFDKIEEWEIQAGSQGYYFSDYDLNTQISNQDKDDIWLPNVGHSSQLP
jgi:serine protease AprX